MSEAEQSKATRSYPPVGLLINGEWRYDRLPCGEVMNPSDESILAPVPGATEEDLDEALKAAHRAFAEWRQVPPLERAALLLRTAVLMRERAGDIGAAITLEHGKPLADARNEVIRSTGFLEWDAAQLQRNYGRIVPTPHPMYQYVVREPVGPVAAFTPWNVPVSAAGRKIGGAIAAGNPVIIKPATRTPVSTCLMAQCFIDAGLPKGVLQVVHGKASEVSRQLILSPVIRMITLTGSTEVGKALTRLAAEGVKPVLMELGGHAAVLIDEDVDPKTVAELSLSAKFRMTGQLCVSPSRFLVHRKVYDDFVSEMAGGANRIKVGDGFATDTQMGPVANARQLDTTVRLVDNAKERGARVVAGGQRIGNRGFFYAPTVLAEVPLEADIMHEEPFGPIAPLVPVGDMDEALAIANDIEVGLAGYVFTNDVVRGDHLSNALQCGSVSINNFVTPGPDAPFGGFKESGIGREGGMESLDAYSTIKTITQSKIRV